MVSQKWGIFTPFHHSGIIKKCLYYIAATEEPRLYEDCITFGLTLPLPYGIWIIGRSIFTRFYPPVGKTLLLWLMDYTHNLKITGNPTLLGTVFILHWHTYDIQCYYPVSLGKVLLYNRTKHFNTSTIHLSDGLGVAHVKCHTTYKSESIVLVWTPGTVTLRLTPSKIRGFINKKPPGDVSGNNSMF